MLQQTFRKNRLLTGAKELLVFVLGLTLVGGSAFGHQLKYTVGGGRSLMKLTGGGFYSFDRESTNCVHVGQRLSDRWRLHLDYSAYKFVNDSERDSTSHNGFLSDNSPLQFEATRLTAWTDRLMFSPDRWWNVSLGVGGGVLIWKAVNPATGTAWEIRSDKDEPTDFDATELILSASGGLALHPLPVISANIRAHADYLTGAGAEFAGSVASTRDRWLLGATVSFGFHFGTPAKPEWRSDSAWQAQPAKPLSVLRRDDSDYDGVPDQTDHCLNTPRGMVVDEVGCPVDGDGDGVVDGYDDCPDTPADAYPAIDVYGCAIDSDFDGVPDYLDVCAHGPVGAQVTEDGCPRDSDNDGVPDGLDDCPFTLVGVAVDRNGCIDLAMFSEPLILNIDYAPGSFEIDPIRRERIRKLAGLLNFVSDIKLEISGYTDNIGTTMANRRLSENRAQRVKTYLASLGVSPERMKVVGRGETDFVASNQTAGGRARNRRIEITFYK